ncbi:MAG: DUF418 domain-containing protein [Mongoliibacter sp.]|nr:MAG: DUF418 domain-containing protein [Mongoliibacter sp.]
MVSLVSWSDSNYWYVVFPTWIFRLIANPIWLRYYHLGPVEWLWRSLSYQQKPPLKEAT